VEGAVSDAPSGTVAFYRHPVKSVWGTTDQAWAARNRMRGDSVRVDVDVVRFADVLDRHGVPAYLKIDIEGGDEHCLAALAASASTPDFVSIESEKADWARLVAEVDALEALGYDRFLAVQQEGRHWRWPRWPWSVASSWKTPSGYRFEEHSSGPFGRDLTGWLTRDELLRRYERIFTAYRLVGDGSLARRTRVGLALLKLLGRICGVPLPGWYDTHAARSSALAGTTTFRGHEPLPRGSCPQIAG
jgi:hypothetical protein